MSRDGYAARIRVYVDGELTSAAHMPDPPAAFHHLERAHVLGQANTRDHVRVHWCMLRWSIAQGDWREFLGQLLRIGGAATKTAFGWIPSGNTGGANVSPFRRMPIARDLAAIMRAARQG